MNRSKVSRYLKGLLICSFLLFGEQLGSFAQTAPKENSALRYRLVGFSFAVSGVFDRYKLEIASGSHNDEDSFKKYVIKYAICNSAKLIQEVPRFGCDYTWRVIYMHKNKVISTSPLHHFSTLYAAEIDSSSTRLRIIKPADKYKDDYVFVDGCNALFDMKGNPVWYLPFSERNHFGFIPVRDLKSTPQSTITYLLNQHAFEISYSGDTLWRGPDDGTVSGGDSERYHHEFTRLANGHYMVLGAERISWNHTIRPVDTSYSLQEDDMTKSDSIGYPIKKTPFGTIIEYDEKGKVVWSWKSSSYFVLSDLQNYMPEGKVKVIDVHENAFSFDEKDSVIYLSFRNISRILKIKYPGGNVINCYGEKFKQGIPPAGNGLFCDQHACKISARGYLYLYNNNPCNDETAMPTVLVLKESPDGRDSLIKIWEYECNTEGIHFNPLTKKARNKRIEMMAQGRNAAQWKQTLLHYTSGGNVIGLSGGDLFVCMNTQYSKLFIVNHDKKVMWSATPEKFNPGDKQWYIIPNLYRASIISRKQLEQLIWHTPDAQKA